MLFSPEDPFILWTSYLSVLFQISKTDLNLYLQALLQLFLSCSLFCTLPVCDNNFGKNEYYFSIGHAVYMFYLYIFIFPLKLFNPAAATAWFKIIQTSVKQAGGSETVRTAAFLSSKPRTWVNVETFLGSQLPTILFEETTWCIFATCFPNHHKVFFIAPFKTESKQW